MQEEIKETIYIGISCMLIAIVFLFLSYAMQLRKEYADVRNEQSNQKEYSELYDEYEAYNGYSEYVSNTWTRSDCEHCLNGADVISAIKKYMCNSGIAICINNNGLGGQDLMIYNEDNQLNYSTEYLQTIIDTSYKYHAILYYGNRSLDNMKSGNYSEYARDKQVTGIVFLRVS